MPQTPQKESMTVIAETAKEQQQADALANELNIPLANKNALFQLTVTAQRLELRVPTEPFKPIFIDFGNGKNGYRWQHPEPKQALSRAIGLKKSKPYVLDATGGMARDAFTLACLGYPIALIERHPIIFALLRDALNRAQQNNALRNGPLHYIKALHHTDAENFLQYLDPIQIPDVIYLDPMYPERNKSALVKKEMRIFRQLVGHDLDAPQLLQAALQSAKQRVVVKRPSKAPVLAGIPSFEINTRNTRYDIYLSS